MGKKYIHIEWDNKDIDTSRDFSGMSYSEAGIALIALEEMKLELIEYIRKLPSKYNIEDKTNEDENN